MKSTLNSFLKRLRHPSVAFLAMLGVVFVAGACDYNIEVFPVKKKLEKIEGTTRCEKQFRVQTKTSGQVPIRIFMVDQNNSSIMPQENRPLDINKLRISTKADFDAVQSTKDLTPKVIDASDGSVVSGATVTLSIIKSGADALKRVINPNYEQLYNSIKPKRASAAVSLLIDMSETAANQDTSLSRTSAAAGWILDEEYFNADSGVGFLDLFQTILMRGNRLSPDDDLFKGRKDADGNPLNYLYENGRASSFLPTTEDNKDIISSEFTNTSNSRARDFPPLYEAIEAAALALRSVSVNPNAGAGDSAFYYNPAAIVLSLERDVNAINKKASGLNKALAAIKATANGLTTFMPVTSVVYPKPDTTKDADWDKHLDELCSIAQKGGVNANEYFGHVIRIMPENRGRRDTATQDFQTMARNAMNAAFHGMKGYHELKVQYNLTGVKAGKRYFVEFSLQGEWLDEKSNPDSSARIIFEVRP